MSEACPFVRAASDRADARIFQHVSLVLISYPMTPPRILLVEDDDELAALVAGRLGERYWSSRRTGTANLKDCAGLKYRPVGLRSQPAPRCG